MKSCHSVIVKPYTLQLISYEKITILEDDKDIIELVQYNLEKEGFKVLAVGDGNIGLSKIEPLSPICSSWTQCYLEFQVWSSARRFKETKH